MRIAALSNPSSIHGSTGRRWVRRFSKPLASFPGGRLIAPPPLRRDRRANWRTAVRAVHTASRHPVLDAEQRAARARRSGRSSDRRRAARQVGLRGSTLGAPAVAPRSACLPMAQRLDPCFVAFREGCEELTRRFPRVRFEWLPFGSSTLMSSHSAGDRARHLRLLDGPSYDAFHQALLRYSASSAAWSYRFTRSAASSGTRRN